MLRAVGFDAVVYLRTLRLCLNVIGTYMIYALLVVLPSNYAGGFYLEFKASSPGNSSTLGGTTDTTQHMSDEQFFRMTVFNIPPGEPVKMIPHFLGTLLLTAITMSVPANPEASHRGQDAGGRS